MASPVEGVELETLLAEEERGCFAPRYFALPVEDAICSRVLCPSRAPAQWWHH